MYSQNDEEKIVLEYFGRFSGIVLDIGANDGITYSNSRELIRRGWSGILVEPSPLAFKKLQDLYGDNEDVEIINTAISNTVGRIDFWDSGEHVVRGSTSLLATAKHSETMRWQGVPFEKISVPSTTIEELIEEYGIRHVDFLTIDCEGHDLPILEQIDLDRLGCQCICIEHNSIPSVVARIRSLATPHGFKEIGYNAENIILAL